MEAETETAQLVRNFLLEAARSVAQRNGQNEAAVWINMGLLGTMLMHQRYIPDKLSTFVQGLGFTVRRDHVLVEIAQSNTARSPRPASAVTSPQPAASPQTVGSSSLPKTPQSPLPIQTNVKREIELFVQNQTSRKILLSTLGDHLKSKGLQQINLKQTVQALGYEVVKHHFSKPSTNGSSSRSTATSSPSVVMSHGSVSSPTPRAATQNIVPQVTTKTRNTQFSLITQLDEYKSAIETLLLANPKCVAVDTESGAFADGTSKLALIQIHYQSDAMPDGHTLLIDIGNNNQNFFQQLKEFKLLKVVFENNAIMKVMHDCREDCRLLFQQAECVVESVFDTQIAHAKLNGLKLKDDQNMDRIGFNDLMKAYGVRENEYKDFVHQMIENDQDLWAAKRPMSKEMIEYARNDVELLMTAFQHIRRGSMLWDVDIKKESQETAKRYYLKGEKPRTNTTPRTRRAPSTPRTRIALSFQPGEPVKLPWQCDPHQFSDDMDLLLDTLPESVCDAIRKHPHLNRISEIIMDKGRWLMTKLSATEVPVGPKAQRRKRVESNTDKKPPPPPRSKKDLDSLNGDQENSDIEEGSDDDDDDRDNDDYDDDEEDEEEKEKEDSDEDQDLWRPVGTHNEQYGIPHRLFICKQVRISHKMIQDVLHQIGSINLRNRAGIKDSLHRISVMRRDHHVFGLTCRVGRPIVGMVQGLVFDLLINIILNKESVVLIGPPGTGKTSLLREFAYLLTHRIGRAVMVVDGSNEIGGGTNSSARTHPALGQARRMHVGKQGDQARCMIEAVENCNPDVVIVDEITSAEEARACRSIALRGVSLIATAHGKSLWDLIYNPDLSNALGGVAISTVGDAMVGPQGSKVRHDMKQPPSFRAAVILEAPDKYLIYTNLETQVPATIAGVHGPEIDDKAIRRWRDSQCDVWEEKIDIRQLEQLKTKST